MGVNTIAHVPSTTDLGDLALAIQKLTDADDVRIVARSYANRHLSKGTETIIAAAQRGTEHAFDSGFDLLIEREEGFGDGDTFHTGSVYLSSGYYGNDDSSDYVGTGTCIYGGTASAFWAALADGLVGFFGGNVDYNDCDSEAADTSKRPTRHSKVKNGDASWTRTQKALNALEVATDVEGLKRYDKVVGLYNRKGEYRSYAHSAKTGEQLKTVRVYPSRSESEAS